MYREKLFLISTIMGLVLNFCNPCLAQEKELKDEEIWTNVEKLYKLLSYDEKIQLLNYLQRLEEGSNSEYELRIEYDRKKSKRKIVEANSDSLPILKVIPFTAIIWQNINHHFGEIKEGDIVVHKFGFTNTSEDSVQIISVKSSCGCTVPNFKTEKIPPKEKGIIEVEFHSYKRKGPQSKLLFVKMNTSPNMHILTLEGVVK